MFTQIRALAVYVTEMQRAKQFYSEVLGFEVSAELGPNLCFLRLGNIHVYLHGGNKPNSIDNRTCRLSFFLQAQDPVAETFATLKAAGVKLLQEKPQVVGDDVATFQFEDPDGNIIEISGRT